MDRKTLLLTLLAAVVVSGVGVCLNLSQQGSADLNNPLVLPELADKAGELTHIRIEAAGNRLIVDSKKQQDKWVIDNLGGYDADIGQLSRLINALKDAHKVEQKTAKPALFHHLGLRDISDPQSQALLISLSGEDGEHQLLIGSNAKNGDGQYVRVVGENQTWLIDQTIEKPQKAVDWVKTTLFDFTLEDIQSVALTGQQIYNLSKADKEQPYFTLDSIPATHKLKYESILDAIPRNISTLDFEQITPIADWSASISENSQTLAVKLFDEREVKLTLVKVDDKHYGHIKGDNPLWSQWVYQISEYAYEQLVKDKVEFLDLVESQIESAAGTPATP
jgi:hypothetical protein